MANTVRSCLGLALGAAGAATLATGYTGPEAAAVAAALGGWAGNLTTDFFKILSCQVAERFLDGPSGIDENHHVSIALRLAQLCALEVVLERFHALIKREQDVKARDAAEGFGRRLKQFLEAETKATKGGKFTADPKNWIDERKIRLKVLNALPDGFDQGLAARRAAGDRNAVLESLKLVRGAVEAAVIEEICLCTPVSPDHIPPLFRSSFNGSSFSPGWFDLFIRDAASRIKEGTDFERIWNAEQIALLKASVNAQTATLAKIETRIHDIPNDFQALLRQWHGIKLDTGREDPLRERIQIRPTELLLARYRIAPFVDCGGILSSIRDWATHSSERRAIGRLYVAPGGFGKTRLAIELLIHLDLLGWRCGFISQTSSEDLTAGALTDLMTGDGAAGVCVAVDWAEAESSRLLLKKIASVARVMDSAGPPIRIIAFARSAQGWWDTFAAEHPQSAIFDPTPFTAIEKEISDEDRRAIFTQSRSAFVAKLSEVGVPHRDQSQNPDLSNADRALLVVAAAFIDAIGIDRGDRSVLQILYEEERSYWRRALKVDSDRKASDLARAVAQVALVQGATIAGATTLMRADDTDRRFPIPDILDELEHRYGVQTVLGDPSRPKREAVPFISPLEPDLLAEHTCIEVLRESGFSLLSATLRAALTGPPLFRDDAAQIMSVLVRAAHPSHDLRIRQGAERAIAVVGELVPELTEHQVAHLADSLPPKSVALSELAVTVARRVVEVAPQDAGEAALVQRAQRQSYLSVCLSGRGSHEDALAASDEAVKLYRQLVAANRTDGLRGLSSALHLHSQSLIELGRRRQAVGPSEEAVQLNRELAETNPEILGPGLAEALRNLGEIYASIGRKEEALQAVVDATARFETLATENPEKFLPALPGVLNSLSNRHIEMGHRKEALDATSKAVDIERTLVAGNRDAYLPGLAITLNNWSRDLLAQGRTEEASAAIDEAVDYHRELAEKIDTETCMALRLH